MSNRSFYHIWFFVRRQVIARRHGRVAKFWKRPIKDYFQGRIPKNGLQPKKDLGSKVIWQYWGQGVDSSSLPATVELCFDSVDRFKGDYQVIRLNDQNLHEYLDLPDYLWQANGEPKFPRVFFSDLLRVALLHVYGGVWLDATVLLTEPFSEKYTQSDCFIFQRGVDEPNKSFWIGPETTYWSWDRRYRVKMLSSIIFAKKGNTVIASMLDLLLNYWKTQDKIVNYFFFQILYHELINGQLKSLKCPVVSDTLPHFLRVVADGREDFMPMGELLQTIGIHKLTYFDDNTMKRLKGLLEVS